MGFPLKYFWLKLSPVVPDAPFWGDSTWVALGQTDQLPESPDKDFATHGS